LQAFAVTFLAVLEFKGVGRDQGLVPFFKCALIKNLSNAFLRGDVKVVFTFWTDIQSPFRFLAENHVLATWATLPKTFRDTSLLPLHGMIVTAAAAWAPRDGRTRFLCTVLTIASKNEFCRGKTSSVVELA
jgi:hypothetical protein